VTTGLKLRYWTGLRPNPDSAQIADSALVRLPADASFCAAQGEHGKPRTGIMRATMKLPNGLEALLAEPAVDGVFSNADLGGLPDTVKRHFAAAIAPGTPLAVSARLRMRGSIKIGRWLPFRARQVLAPLRGTVWAARVGGVIVGSDHYAVGHGGMDWKLAGLTITHAEGPDVSRSSAERAAAEACWIPTCLLPRFGVEWTATDDAHISARFDVDGHPVQVDYHIATDGKVRSLVLERWGDPNNTGTWGLHPFGVEVTGYDTFDGVTVPSAGCGGWFFGTDRWEQGAFMRYHITDLSLVTT
jgi:hypothetical protein